MQSNLVLNGVLETKLEKISIRNVETLFSRVLLTGLEESIQVKGLLEKYHFNKKSLMYVAPYIHYYLDQLGVSNEPITVSSLGKYPISSDAFWTHYYDPVDKLLAMSLAVGELSYESQEKENPNKCYVLRK